MNENIQSASETAKPKSVLAEHLIVGNDDKDIARAEALEPEATGFLATEATAAEGSDSEGELVTTATVAKSGNEAVGELVGEQSESVSDGAVQDAPVDSMSSDSRSLPVVVPARTASPVQPPAGQTFLGNLPEKLRLFVGQNGKAYAVINAGKSSYAQAVGSRGLRNHLRKLAIEAHIHLKKADLAEIVDFLQAHAENAGNRQLTWYRVAPVEGGIEIELGDESYTRVRITADKVEIVESGSEALFYRTTQMMPLAYPATVGNLDLLKKHVYLRPAMYKLWLGWITFTMATPKRSSAKYPILSLVGGQGSTKTALAKLSQRLVDPSSIGVQKLHGNSKDFAIAAQSNHVLAFDNLRTLAADLSDTMCMAATGGNITSRQLYTDCDLSVLNVHVALILNGIHSFVNQSDMAQRTLPLHLEPMPEKLRKSDAELEAALVADLPQIQRGLFELISKVFAQLPHAQVTNPERMIDFVKWLAAMERVDGVTAGVYQAEYSYALQQGQLDSMQESILATAIMDLSEASTGGVWSGTPAELLVALDFAATPGTKRSRDWPTNAIALSKRLSCATQTCCRTLT